MQINSINIPDSMVNRGGYVFTRPVVLGYNGLRMPVIADGGSTLEWTFDELDDDEWEWWTQTILGGDDAAAFTQAQLYDDDRALTTFGNCIVYKPIREKFLHGKHSNVKVVIAGIE
jgi:hypothetical protein